LNVTHDVPPTLLLTVSEMKRAVGALGRLPERDRRLIGTITTDAKRFLSVSIRKAKAHVRMLLVGPLARPQGLALPLAVAVGPLARPQGLALPLPLAVDVGPLARPQGLALPLPLAVDVGPLARPPTLAPCPLPLAPCPLPLAPCPLPLAPCPLPMARPPGLAHGLTRTFPCPLPVGRCRGHQGLPERVPLPLADGPLSRPPWPRPWGQGPTPELRSVS
jgi:hypothetical protein